jgi:hypothetical protein
LNTNSRRCSKIFNGSKTKCKNEDSLYILKLKETWFPAKKRVLNNETLNFLT